MATYSGNIGEIQDRRLFITRLAPRTKRDYLLELFKSRGAQHAVIIRKPTGNQAFITFETPAQTQETLRATKGSIICHNRKLKILPADAWHHTKLITPRPDVNPFPGLDLSEPIPLPIECISIIASFLPFIDRAQLEMTSRRWRQGTLLSYRTIRSINLDDWRWPEGWDGKRVTSDSLYWLAQRAGNKIKHIRLNNEAIAKDLQPQIITILIKNCPYTEAIDLTGTIIRPSAIRAVETVAHQLTDLSIGTCQGPIETHLTNIFNSSTRLRSFCTINTNFSGKSLIRHNLTLEKLCLSNNDDLHSEHISHVLSRLTTLKHLEIKSCTGLTNADTLRALSNNTAYNHSLKTLKLHDCVFGVFGLNMPEEEEEEEQPDFIRLDLGPIEQIDHLPSNLQAVTTLSLTFCGWVTTTFILEITTHMKNLLSLDLSGCTNIRGEFSLNPLIQLDTLKILHINYMHPSISGEFLQFFVSLIEIHVRGNIFIHNEQMADMLRNCTKLEIVDVESCNRIGQPLLISASDIIRNRSRGNPVSLYVGNTLVNRLHRYRKHTHLRIVYDPLYRQPTY
ncbi:hypothetical protein ANTQUA_LOCUS8993 [Anthophora quadrimaculata]